MREPGKPVFNISHEYADVLLDTIPDELPAYRGLRHEIVLVTGSKYGVTRQLPLPRDQAKILTLSAKADASRVMCARVPCHIRVQISA